MFLLQGCGGEPPEEEIVKPVKTMVLGKVDAEGGRAYPGTVQAVDRSKLSFRVNGPLVQLPIDEGQQITKGQLLGQIDPTDYQNAVNSLEATVAQLKNEYEAMLIARPEDIRRAQADLDASRARELEARATFRRYRKLYENDNVSKAEFDQRRAARDVSIAEVESSEQQLQIALVGERVEDIRAMEDRIRSVEAQLKQARDNLSYTNLIAPYDGIVAEKYVENFEFVRAQQLIVSLQDISTVEIVAQIPEQMVAGADTANMPEFVVRFEALPGKTFKTTPFEIATEADPMTRTYAVTFQTPQPKDGRVFSGMTAEVMLKVRSKEELVFTLPAPAVFADHDDKMKVWVVDPESMRVIKTTVEVGDVTADSAIVTSGLNLGEMIVTAGAGYLVDGMKVREAKDELRKRM